MNAVDTNIFVYAFDSHEPVKRDKAIEFLAGCSGLDTLTPWQVACEFSSVLFRLAQRGKFSGDLRATVASVRGRFPIVLPKLSTLDLAVDIQLQDQVSPWDSLLIAACVDAGVTRLYTEDLQSRASIRGVAFIDPLA